MDQQRRRRFVVVAVVIWAITIPFLCFFVPPQPRLTIRTAGPASIIGTTSDSRTMYTSALYHDEEERSYHPTGLIQAWDLTAGRERDRFNLDQFENPPAERKNDEDSGKKISAPRHLRNFLLSAAGQALAYDYAEFDGDRSLRVRGLRSGAELLRVDGCSVDDLHFSPDGNWFVVNLRNSENAKRHVRVFESATGAEVLFDDPETPLEYYGGSFSPDSRLFAMSEKIGKLWQTRVWQLAPLSLRRTLDNYLSTSAISPDGRLLASGQRHTVNVANLETGKTLVLKAHQDYVAALAFSHDGRRLTAFNDLIGNGRSLSRATTWDVETGRVLQSFVPPVDRVCVDPNDGWSRRRFNDQDVTRTPAIWVQPDEPVWRVFDVIKGVQVALVPENAMPVRVSPDCRILITHEERWLRDVVPREGVDAWLREHIPGYEKIWLDRERLQMWDLTTGREIASFNTKAGAYRFTPDSNTLILDVGADRIEVWDVPPGWPIKMFLARSLPLLGLVLLVGEWRFRRRRRVSKQPAGAVGSQSRDEPGA